MTLDVSNSVRSNYVNELVSANMYFIDVTLFVFKFARSILVQLLKPANQYAVLTGVISSRNTTLFTDDLILFQG